MRYKLKCRVCGQCIWIRGHDEPNVNALVLDDNDPNWNDGCEHINDGNCEYDVVDQEYPDDDDNY